MWKRNMTFKGFSGKIKSPDGGNRAKWLKVWILTSSTVFGKSRGLYVFICSYLRIPVTWVHNSTFPMGMLWKLHFIITYKVVRKVYDTEWALSGYSLLAVGNMSPWKGQLLQWMTQWERVNYRIIACWRWPSSSSMWKKKRVCRKMSESLHIKWSIMLILRTGISWGRSKEKLVLLNFYIIWFFTLRLLIYCLCNFLKCDRINVLKCSWYVCNLILELLAFLVIFGFILIESAGHSGGKRWWENKTNVLPLWWKGFLGLRKEGGWRSLDKGTYQKGTHAQVQSKHPETTLLISMQACVSIASTSRMSPKQEGYPGELHPTYPVSTMPGHSQTLELQDGPDT